MIKKEIVNEKLINDALKQALREKDATRSLEIFIEHMGRESGSERFYIFEGNRKNGMVCNTFEWCAKGISEEKDNLQRVPFEAVEWWYQIFEDRFSLIIKNVEDIKESEPLTYEYLKPQNIHSLIASPLILEDEIIGFYGVDNPPPEIMENITDFAEIVGHFIASLLDKQRLMVQLEKLSYEDPLCGVQNRHALSRYIDTYKDLTTVGVLYCDVMGLKKINDSQGHQAGDELLIRAAQCLKDIFPRKVIYRLGGDEFLVLYQEEQAKFLANVEKLRKDMQEKNARMALGFVWEENVTNLDAIIAQADEFMYQEKRAYYAAH